MKNEEWATAIDNRRKKREVWAWRMLLCAAFFALHSSLFTSCSEDSEDEEEYANWQERNDNAISQWAADTSLRKIKNFTKDQTTTGVSSDYIYVEVLEEGSGTESPLYTDTVWVAYRGRLIPSKSYPDGYVFDQSYQGDFSWTTSDVFEFSVNGLVEGFGTALMAMKPGDRWRVHIPYMLGYGSSSTSTSVPAYSNLTFDIALFDFWHPGETRPFFKSR